MKLYKLNYWGLGILIALVSACGGGGGNDGGGDSPGIAFTLDCSAVPAYNPANPPRITSSTAGSANTTLVVLHGKSGSPSANHLQTFYTDMAGKGYDVIAPYMPWSGTTWDGNVCEAMTYIDQLAQAEIDQGKDVVVVGHSMGAVHALIYGATEPPSGVQAIVPIAPGHMPHQSTGFQIAVADEINRANSLVANNQGYQYYDFDTPNNGNPITISTTPNIYLSYHALDQFPDMRGVLPIIDLPVLWIAGTEDNLTNVYNMAGLAAEINSADSGYRLLSGTHLGVVANAPNSIEAWLTGLGI